MTKRLGYLLWPLGVGMLTGWVCLYLFLVYVLVHGGKIQGWHSLVWVLATFLGTWIVARGQGVEDGGQMSEGGERKTEGEGQKTEDGGRSTESKHPPSGIRHLASDLWHQIRISGALTCLAIILPLVFGWVLGHFTDFSWDGMTSRGITVRNLMIGEPTLNAYPFGHVLAGFLAHITGNWQAGKGINLVLIWISFCIVFSSLEILKFKGFSVWFLAIITAMSPVAIYQISCFQIDGHIASLATCLIFLMLRIFMSETVKAESMLFVVVTGIALSAAKTSGVFYGTTIFGVFVLFQGLASRSRKKLVFTLIVSAIMATVGFSIREVALGQSLDLNRLRAVASIKTPGFGVGEGASGIPDLSAKNKLGQFIASSCAYTEIYPTTINIKPIFWMQRRELRVFEELTPDPRAGGFGPLYSTALLLAGAGCLYLLFCGQGGMYWPAWFLLLGAVASSFGSQVWWARWTPQNWLIVIAFLMTILASPTEGKTFKGVRALAMLAAGLNVLLITLYYFVGMIKQEKILNRQIELSSSLKNPVPIYISVMKEGHNAGASFVASEWWFVDRGTPVTKLEKEPIRPRMRIHKTATYIPLPSDWRLSLKSPKDEELFRKRGLIED